MDYKKNPKLIAGVVIGVIVLVVGAVVATLAITHRNSVSPVSASTSSSTQPSVDCSKYMDYLPDSYRSPCAPAAATCPNNTSATAIPIVAGDVISNINKIRQNSYSSSALTENTQLDAAATARAQYMATSGVTDNTSGNPWSFVTNNGYTYSNIDLQSTYNQQSSQEAAQRFTCGTNMNPIGISDNYTDIGVGTAQATISGNSTQIVVLYIATPQSGQ